MDYCLHYCRFPDSVIILDPISDRYRLLQGKGADCFVRAVDGNASGADKSWLSKNQINLDHICEPALISVPSSSALDDAPFPPGLVPTLKAAWTQRSYERRLSKKPLHTILETLAAERPDSPLDCERRTMEIVAGMSRAKRCISSYDKCLPLALAITHMLFRRGINAQLVFGVTIPFAAHSWVQQGDIVLSDPLDRVLPFRPIMVI